MHVTLYIFIYAHAYNSLCAYTPKQAYSPRI